MRNIKREAQVPQTAQQMFNLVDRVEDYPLFLPWCSKTEIHLRTEDEVRASISILAAGFEKSFTTQNRLQAGKMIEIKLIDGPFKHLEGFWLFEDLTQGSLLLLDLEFELSGGLFSFAFEPIFNQVANSLVDAFVTRANEQHAVCT